MSIVLRLCFVGLRKNFELIFELGCLEGQSGGVVEWWKGGVVVGEAFGVVNGWKRNREAECVLRCSR